MLSVFRAEHRSALPVDTRAREFAYLDEQRLCYLDYTGAALPAQSQLAAQSRLVGTSVFGNPHSLHGPSRLSGDSIEAARVQVLRFLDADPDDYAVIFTANTTAAIKLVGESFPFRAGSVFVRAQDNHNSVNGVRELAARAGARTRTIPLDRSLRLSRPRDVLSKGRGRGASLFAFPAQSNFSGVKHPLTLVTQAQRLGYAVLLDAAAFLPANPISLRQVRPEFLVMSMYKLFGFPAGVGALVVRRDALANLSRPWFSGGTVDWVSSGHRLHRLRNGVEGFEDGTPNFSGIASLAPGFDFLARIGMSAVHAHVADLTAAALHSLRTRRHLNGRPVFRVYGPAESANRGGTIAFNVLNASGALVDYEKAEAHAAANGIAIRGGCFCNPGAAEAALELAPAALNRCLESSRDDTFSPRRLGECLGSNVPVGALRISVGVANTHADVDKAVDVLSAFVSG